MASYKKEYWLSDGAGRTRKERLSGAYESYQPDVLMGQEFLFYGDTLAASSEAEQVILSLNNQAASLANTEPLARLIMRAEAVASSRIEGLEVGARKLLQEEALQRAGKNSSPYSTANEVIGNINAMTSAIEEAAQQETITVAVFQNIHQKLLEGSRLEKYGGLIRTSQNWIGGNSYNPIGASYVPPCAQEMPSLLSDLAAFCNEKHISPLAQAALVHAQFETIHPFVDGNGRTGRALVHLILRKRGLAPHVVPPISLILATEKNSYLQFLSEYRYLGEADSPQARDARNEWVEFFCNASQRAAQDALDFEDRIKAIQTHWADLANPRKDSAAFDLINLLPGMPVFNIDQAANVSGKSFEALRLAVDKFIHLGILTQSSKARRNRYFEAPDIIEEFTRYERALATKSGDTRSEEPRRAVPYRKK